MLVFSPTYFTKIHLNFCLNQHTASSTFRKFFTNIGTASNVKEQNSGKTNFLVDFDYGDRTEVSSSCGASLFGEHYVFGGGSEYRQVRFSYQNLC